MTVDLTCSQRVPTDGEVSRYGRRALVRMSGLGAIGSLLTSGLAHAAPLSYRVPGTVSPIKQPKPNACWATVATILYSWKNNASYDVPTVMGKVGANYLSIYNADTGLSATDKPGFLQAMKLTSEAPQNYTIAGWEGALRKHGLLWVTTAEGKSFSIHARILTGILGDGTPTGTSFTIVDPADGQTHTETVADFMKKFEDVARADLGSSGELRPQVVRY